MNIKSTDRLNKIRLLNDIVSQKTIGAYNKITYQSELNDREVKVKNAFEKAFILHTSQRSDFNNLKIGKEKKRINLKDAAFIGPALFFTIASIEIIFAFILFIYSNQAIAEDNSLASLTRLNTSSATQNIYLEPKNLDISIQTHDISNEVILTYIERLRSEGFREVTIKNSKLDNLNCIIQTPQNISPSIVGRIQKIIAKSCEGLDRIEDTVQEDTINIIIGRNGDT